MSPTSLPATRLLDPGVERPLARLEQPLGLGRDLADRERPRRVGDEAVERDADVDREQVALLEPVRAGDAVHDHVVRRGADRGRVALVALEGRRAALGADVLLGGRVELGGRDARPHRLLQQRERVGDDLAGARHRLDLGLRLADDHAGRPLEPVEGVADLLPDLLDRRRAVDRRDLVAGAVPLDERRRQGVVVLEPAVDRLRRVVGAALDPGALEHPLDGDVVGHLEHEHGVELAADLAQHRVERLRLGEVCAGSRRGRSPAPRPAAASRSRIRSTISSSGTRSPRSMIGRARTPSSVPRATASRSMSPVETWRDPVLVGDPHRLRALAGALGAEDQQVHGYFKKPS